MGLDAHGYERDILKHYQTQILFFRDDEVNNHSFQDLLLFRQLTLSSPEILLAVAQAEAD